MASLSRLTHLARGKGWTLLDENDPYPRKVSLVPPYLCELYDKAVIADAPTGWNCVASRLMPTPQWNSNAKSKKGNWITIEITIRTERLSS